MIMNIMSDMLKNLGISLRARGGTAGSGVLGEWNGLGERRRSGGRGAWLALLGWGVRGPDFDGEERILDFLTEDIYQPTDKRR
jgi:hypothetical protein